MIKRRSIDNNDMEKIIPYFEETLFDNNLVDVCVDLSELGIDSLFDNPIIETIPIVKFAIGTFKTARNIFDRNLLRQTFNFIKGFNDGSIDKDKLKKYQDIITNDKKKAEEELGKVLILLNKNTEVKKSVIIGRFFNAYVIELIDWVTFCDLADAIDGLFLSDLDLLKRLKESWFKENNSKELFRGYRLGALGLVDTKIVGKDDGDGNVEMVQYITLTEFGKMFVDYGL